MGAQGFQTGYNLYNTWNDAKAYTTSLKTKTATQTNTNKTLGSNNYLIH